MAEGKSKSKMEIEKWKMGNCNEEWRVEKGKLKM